MLVLGAFDMSHPFRTAQPFTVLENVVPMTWHTKSREPQNPSQGTGFVGAGSHVLSSIRSPSTGASAAKGPGASQPSRSTIIAPALKEMLRSRDAAAASRALLAVHAYATCDAKDRGGLGVCGRAWDLTALSAAVNASRRNHPGLGDRALATLRVLEAHGGPGSLGKIKKGVLDYVSKDFGSTWE